MFYIGIRDQRNNFPPIPVTKYLGSKPNRSNISTDLRIGPFLLTSKNNFLKVYLFELNKDDGAPSYLLFSLINTLIKLMGATYNLTSLAETTNIISSS